MTELDETMTPPTHEPPSRLEVIHAAVFTAGFVLTAAGFIGGMPELFLVSGPCLIVSSLLLWVGIRVTFAGPFGRVLRAALGHTRLVSLHARALSWLAIGIAITLWGTLTVTRAPNHESLPLPPHVSQAH